MDLRLAIGLLVASSILASTPAPRAKPAPGPPAIPPVFERSLKDYVSLHRKLEATLPKLSKEASPEQIDKNQRALAALIQAERRGARQGEIFTPEMQRYVRQAFDAIFAGPEGKALIASLMDENPGTSKLQVNARYPDDVPLSTMPPEVLNVLPKLEEDMEFRFVGRSLVLLDAHAHLIVDFMNDAVPAGT